MNKCHHHCHFHHHYNHQHQNHQQWQYNLPSLPSGGSTCSPTAEVWRVGYDSSHHDSTLRATAERGNVRFLHRVQFKLPNLKSDGSFSKLTLVKYRPITCTLWRASLKTESFGNVTNEWFQKTSRWKDEYVLLKLTAWDLSVLVASVHGLLHLTVFQY